MINGSVSVVIKANSGEIFVPSESCIKGQKVIFEKEIKEQKEEKKSFV